MPVDLGFLEARDSSLLGSHHFPSKIGGFPAWLSLKNLPKWEDLGCEICGKQLIFLCQVYAPYEDDQKNFHRTIFIFICKNPFCCKKNKNSNLKVYRSNLKRKNDFYDIEPPTLKTKFDLSDYVKVCALCGNFAEKHCSNCKDTHYCSREHQVTDWKNGHKHFCQDRTFKVENKVIFPEYKLAIEEEFLEKDEKSDEAKMAEFENMILTQNGGTLADVPEAELETYTAVDADKVFLKFKKVIEHEPEQVLRYDRGGQPLLVAENPKPDVIPNCENCGSKRQFEFQILPQLLYELKEEELDWGTLLVYTCQKSCEDGSDYKKEYIFKQDLAE